MNGQETIRRTLTKVRGENTELKKQLKGARELLRKAIDDINLNAGDWQLVEDIHAFLDRTEITK